MTYFRVSGQYRPGWLREDADQGDGEGRSRRSLSGRRDLLHWRMSRPPHRQSPDPGHQVCHQTPPQIRFTIAFMRWMLSFWYLKKHWGFSFNCCLRYSYPIFLKIFDFLPMCLTLHVKVGCGQPSHGGYSQYWRGRGDGRDGPDILPPRLLSLSGPTTCQGQCSPLSLVQV